MHSLNQDLEHFLASVEKKGLRIAQFSCSSSDEGFDLLQDAMIRFVERYSHKPQEEWKPLFYRILRNRIKDRHRREAVRAKVLRRNTPRDGNSGHGVEALPGPMHDNPEQALASDTAIMTLQTALRALPEKQRQAFLFRQWEGMSVAETAVAMKVSQGSVKTHYSRAVHSLRQHLEGHWP